MATYDVTVHPSGPIFDGRADEALDRFTRAAARKVAETGQDWIKIAANEMDRSGRGGTGRAAEGVVIYERDVGYAIFGAMDEGVVWWPWLEGSTTRNATTRFKGYHTFRTTARRLEDHLQEIIKANVEELDRELGGA